MTVSAPVERCYGRTLVAWDRWERCALPKRHRSPHRPLLEGRPKFITKAEQSIDYEAFFGSRKPALAQEHSETSKEAARRLDDGCGRRQALREAVYAAISAAPAGLTDEEGQTATGLEGSTYRPRRVELVEAGRVVDSKRTRLTRSGRRAVVWVVA
jgi:hypothetical protein